MRIIWAVCILAALACCKGDAGDGESTATGENAPAAGSDPKTATEPAADPKTAPEPAADPAVDPEYARDMKRICDAEKLSGAGEIADQNERVQKMAMWLKDNIKTPEASNLMRSFASVPPGERERLLRSEAKKAGVDACPLADSGGR